MPHTPQGSSLIGYEQAASSGSSFQAINPATNETLPITFYEAAQTDINNALTLAQQAYRTYKNTSPQTRADFLNKIATNLRDNATTIIKQAQQESALPEGRLNGELERTASQLELFARVVLEGHWRDVRIDTAEGQPDIRRMLGALGPVVVFGASNFPLAFSVAGGDTASALAAGCPVVAKGHPSHPATSELVAKLIVDAARDTSMPEGVFSLIQGAKPETSIALVTHPLTAAVAFTGSGKVGRILFDAAAKRDTPIPVFSEMGSTNPMFMFPSALENADALAQAFAASLTLGAGQFCTNPGVCVVIDSPQARTFVNKLAQHVTGQPTASMLNSGIYKNYCNALELLASQEGVSFVGDMPVHDDAINAGGHAVLRTDASTFLKNHSLQEEVFGPATLIVYCQNDAERLQVAEHLHGHLTASIHANEAELAAHTNLLSLLSDKVGRLIFNGFPTGVAVNHAMQHGGPYPASTDARFTSVGSAAILRFAKPICYQDCPDSLLPPELQQANPLNLWRLVNGKLAQH